MRDNLPDIVVNDLMLKTKSTFLLIDIAVPSDQNFALKELEKWSKYKYLETDAFNTSSMKWNQ